MMHSLLGPLQRDARYRVVMRAAGGEKAVPWLQYRVLGVLWWRDHSPVANDLNSLKHQFVKAADELRGLQKEIADAEAWLKNSVKMVQDSGLANQSHPFEARWVKPIAPIPEPKLEYEEALKRLRPTSKGASPRSEEDGTVSSYIMPEKFRDGTYNRTKISETSDHIIDYRAPTPQNQGKRGSKGQNGQQGGGRTLQITLPEDGDTSGNGG